MKKVLFSLLALATIFTACQTTTTEGPVDEVDVNITASASQVVTRGGNLYGGDKASDKGGVTNIDWSKYDLRYILEVYNTNDELAKERQYFISTDGYQDAQFNLRLTPNREYTFVVWADFIEEGAAQNKDLHYNTASLLNIAVLNHNVYDESRDAYFVTEPVLVTNSLTKTLTLNRPFGKLRVVTTDIEELDLNTYPTSVTVEYTAGARINSINALTGEVGTVALPNNVAYTYSVTKDDYIANYDSLSTHQTLFVDYIFAEKEDCIVNFKISANDNKNKLINEYVFNTDIPVRRNTLTTLIGNVLTTGTQFTIQIDEFFADTVTIPLSGNIIYVLNGGVTNDFGWQNKQDMYETLNADYNAFYGVDTKWTPLANLTAVNLGIPMEGPKLGETITGDPTFKAHFGWLITYMEAVCTTQGVNLPLTSASYLRYNLSAFFLNSVRTSWPRSADYTEAGSVEYFQSTWKGGFCGPDRIFEGESIVLSAPYKEGYTFDGWYTTADFSSEKVTTLTEPQDVTLYAKFTK